MRVCMKGHIEACMKVHMKVSMNIDFTVWKISIKTCSEVCIELYSRSCQKAVLKVVTLMFAGHIA